MGGGREDKCAREAGLHRGCEATGEGAKGGRGTARLTPPRGGNIAADTTTHWQGLQNTLLKPLIQVLVAVAPVRTSGPADRGARHDNALDLMCAEAAL